MKMNNLHINLWNDPKDLFGDIHPTLFSCPKESVELYELDKDKLYTSYHKYKDSLCYIGTRSLKFLLSSLYKKGDLKAAVYKSLLDVETYHYYSSCYFDTQYHHLGSIYQDKLYEYTHQLIESIEVFNSKNNDASIKYGYINKQYNIFPHLMVIDIEGTQVSFHTNLDVYNIQQVNLYEGIWDGFTESNLEKLNSIIYNMYSNEIEKCKAKKTKIVQESNIFQLF